MHPAGVKIRWPATSGFHPWFSGSLKGTDKLFVSFLMAKAERAIARHLLGLWTPRTRLYDKKLPSSRTVAGVQDPAPQKEQERTK
jgi:hypothetical protein